MKKIKNRIVCFFLPLVITVSSFGVPSLASTRYRSQGNLQTKIEKETRVLTSSSEFEEKSSFEKILEREREKNADVLKQRSVIPSQESSQTNFEMKEEFPLTVRKLKEENEIIPELREFHVLVKMKKQEIKPEREISQNYEELSNQSFYNLQMEEKLESNAVIFFYCYFVAQTIETTLRTEVEKKILGLSGGWVGFSGTNVLWEILKDHLNRREKPRDRQRNRYQNDDGYYFPTFPLPFPPLVIALTAFYIMKKYGPDLEKVPVDLLKKTFESKEDKRKRENAEAWKKFWKEWADFFLAIYRFFITNPQYLPLIPVFVLIVRNREFLGKLFGNVKNYGEFSKALTIPGQNRTLPQFLDSIVKEANRNSSLVDKMGEIFVSIKEIIFPTIKPEDIVFDNKDNDGKYKLLGGENF